MRQSINSFPSPSLYAGKGVFHNNIYLPRLVCIEKVHEQTTFLIRRNHFHLHHMFCCQSQMQPTNMAYDLYTFNRLFQTSLGNFDQIVSLGEEYINTCDISRKPCILYSSLTIL